MSFVVSIVIGAASNLARTAGEDPVRRRLALERALKSALAQTVACDVVLVEEEDTGVAVPAGAPITVLPRPAAEASIYPQALAACAGEFVIFLDPRDTLEPDAAARVREAYKPGVALVHAPLAAVDANGLSFGHLLPRALASGAVLEPMLRSGVLYAGAPPSGNAYRKSLLEQLEPFPVPGADDLFMACGSLLSGTVVRLADPLGRFDASADRRAEQIARRQALALLPGYLSTCALAGARPLMPAALADVEDLLRAFSERMCSGQVARDLATRADPAVSTSQAVAAVWRGVLHQSAYPLVLKFGLCLWALVMRVVPARVARWVSRLVIDPVDGATLKATTREALVYVYAGYLVRYVSLLILLPFYGRVLGTDAYGQVLAAMSLYAVVVTLVAHGFSTVGSRDLACNPDRATAAREFGRHLHARSLLTVPGILVGVAGTWISPALREHPWMGALATVFALAHAFNLGWFFQGLSRFKISIALEVFGFLFSLGLILGFVRGPQDNWIVLAALCAAHLSANAVSYALARRYMERSKRAFAGGVALMREATPVFLVGGLATLAVGASSYILSLHASVTEVGYFGSAERIAAIVVALMMPANQVLLSTVSSRLHAGGDREDGFALMRMALGGMLLCSVAASLLVAGLAPWVLPWVLGDAFRPSVPLLQGLALMYPFVAFSQVINMYVLIPLRMDRIAMKVATVGTLLHVSLIFFASWRWHGEGAVIARVTSEIVMAAMLGLALTQLKLWRPLLRRSPPMAAHNG